MSFCLNFLLEQSLEFVLIISQLITNKTLICALNLENIQGVPKNVLTFK